VAEFLSAEWVAELDALARRVGTDVSGPGDPITVELHVQGAPDGEFVFQAAFGEGTSGFVAGSPSEPDLVVLVDHSFAARIHSGDANAQEALAAGALKVRGDLGVLTRVGGALAGLGDRVAGLRPTTTEPGPSAAPRSQGRR
jgi:hypothetical protein